MRRCACRCSVVQAWQCCGSIGVAAACVLLLRAVGRESGFLNPCRAPALRGVAGRSSAVAHRYVVMANGGQSAPECRHQCLPATCHQPFAIVIHPLVHGPLPPGRVNAKRTHSQQCCHVSCPMPVSYNVSAVSGGKVIQRAKVLVLLQISSLPGT